MWEDLGRNLDCICGIHHLVLGMLGAKEAEMESVEVRTQPAWFTAPRFTFLLCFMLFWVYVDRGELGKE